MSSSVSWSDSKAGYDPGQKQSLKVTFKSRDEGKVVVHYEFHAKSLGYDSFTYSERHNKVTIWVGGKSKSFTYQAHGSSASRSESGNITITGVKNDVTSLTVQYRNQRIWVNAPSDAWSPRSTGVHSKSTIGHLTIPEAAKYDITYNGGYKNGSLSDLPSNKKNVYSGTTCKVSSNKVKDNNNHYVFRNGYTTSLKGNVNVQQPDSKYNIGDEFKLTKDLTLYACWTPQTYTYNFYSSYADGKYGTKWPLSSTYTYTKAAAILPNLNNYTDNNTTKNEYYKEGYNFIGWDSAKGQILVSNGLSCTFDANTNFYPIWKPITTNIRFNFGFIKPNTQEQYIETVSYKYDDLFDFRTLYKDTSPTLVRPGYKLMGWTTDKSKANIIYNPFQSEGVLYKLDTRDYIKIPSSMNNRAFENNGLDLYAIWEYYTTAYVYTDNEWKLALPYVYTDNEWKIALAYTYTDINSDNPSWKL